MFRPWWQAVEGFFRYHGDSQDHEKIAFVGSRLEGKALEWHQKMEQLMGNNDTWAAYSQEMEEHYSDRAEEANAYKELEELKYKGDIQAYMIALRALNHFARMTGEALKKTVDQAIGRKICDTCAFRTHGRLDNDVDFLAATLDAGLDYEERQKRFAALNFVSDRRKVQYSTDLMEEREEKRRNRRGGKSGRKEKERDERRKREDEEETGGRKSGRKTQQDQGADVWRSTKDSLAGIAQHEIDEHKSIAGRNGCWRCGNQNHRTF